MVIGSASSLALWRAPRRAGPDPPFDEQEPATTTPPERQALATSLLDVLGKNDALATAEFLVEMSVGKTGCRYMRENLTIDVRYRPRPLDEVAREFRGYLHQITHARGRTRHEVGWNDASNARLAQAVATCVLADQPEQADEFRSLLHDYGDPYTAYEMQQKLDRVPAEHRALARQTVDRLHTHDSEGQPLRWGPPQNWLSNARRVLFLGSLLQSGQPWTEASDTARRLGPRLDALKLGDEERWRYPAEHYRDPGESPLPALERHIQLIDKLCARGVPPPDASRAAGSLSHRLPAWREVFPGQSADEILHGLVDALAASRLPAERLECVASSLSAHLKPGETARKAIIRLEKLHDHLKKRFRPYGAKALDEGFRTAVTLPDKPTLAADLADLWSERHHPDDLNSTLFFYSARSFHEPHDTAESLAKKLERNQALTGSFNDLHTLEQNVRLWAGEGKVPPEQADELAASLPGWLAALRLTGNHDPRLTVFQTLQRDLSARFDVQHPLIERLGTEDRPILEVLTEVGMALGESERLGRKLSYPRPSILALMTNAIEQAGVEGARTVPAVLTEVARSGNAPPVEALPDMVEATLEQPDLPLATRVANSEHSRYLTGSYRGLRQAHQRLEAARANGSLRQDVPLDELRQALEKQILHLRVSGAPAENTVERAFEWLQDSRYSAQGSALGQTLGILAENRLAVGGVPLKIRPRDS